MSAVSNVGTDMSIIHTVNRFVQYSIRIGDKSYLFGHTKTTFEHVEWTVINKQYCFY